MENNEDNNSSHAPSIKVNLSNSNADLNHENSSNLSNQILNSPQKIINEEEKKNNEDEMSINLHEKSNNSVIIKIPVNETEIWEKEYNKNEQIGTVIKDYLEDNSLNVSNNYINKIKSLNNNKLDAKISVFLPNNDLESNSSVSENSLDLSIMNN